MARSTRLEGWLVAAALVLLVGCQGGGAYCDALGLVQCNPTGIPTCPDGRSPTCDVDFMPVCTPEPFPPDNAYPSCS
jgi:hypothetical protein